MPFIHTIAGRLITFTWSGTLTRAELQCINTLMPELSRTVVTQEGDVPQVLHDFSALDGCDFPPITAYEHSVERKRILIPHPIKSATIAKTSEVRAMARVVQALNRNPNLEMEIFDTKEAALAWLKQE
jgi:hypothetical protein